MIASKKPRAGFSLLELLAVVTILGVLTAAVVPRISKSGVQAKKEMCAQRVTEVNRALEQYFMNEDKRAVQLTELSEVTYFPNGFPTCPLTENAYLIDENSGRVAECACRSK